MRLLLILCFSVISTVLGTYEERLRFHGRLCREKPNLKSCQQSFTEKEYGMELLHEQNYKEYKRMRAATTGEPIKNDRKRASPWYQSDDDDDYEYYMWRKYQREKHRRRLGYRRQQSSETELHEHEHYHYHQETPQYRSTYYSPSYSYYPYYSYPSYSYPSYGYGSGYGGGYGGYGGGGGLFNIGFGRHLGISTPIGGFGYSSGFGIGIGK